MIKKILAVLLIDLLVLILFCVLISYLFNKIEITEPSYLIIGICMFMIIGLANGFIFKHQGFLVGTISGSSICLLLTLIIILALDKDISILKFAIYVVSASLGGIIGKNLHKKK